MICVTIAASHEASFAGPAGRGRPPESLTRFAACAAPRAAFSPPRAHYRALPRGSVNMKCPFIKIGLCSYVQSNGQ